MCGSAMITAKTWCDSVRRQSEAILRRSFPSWDAVPADRRRARGGSGTAQFLAGGVMASAKFAELAAAC